MSQRNAGKADIGTAVIGIVVFLLFVGSIDAVALGKLFLIVGGIILSCLLLLGLSEILFGISKPDLSGLKPSGMTSGGSSLVKRRGDS